MPGGSRVEDELNMGGAELFCECLALATLVVKQVLPSHIANQTPDPDMDVRDVISGMLQVIERLPMILEGGLDPVSIEDVVVVDINDQDTIDLCTRWQLAADNAEAAVLAIDPEDLIRYGVSALSTENYLFRLAGDFLIHAWDIGEGIGMVVRFRPDIAEAVMETTMIPNKTTLARQLLPSHQRLFVSATADPQTRLLALFGRGSSWRET